MQISKLIAQQYSPSSEPIPEEGGELYGAAVPAKSAQAPLADAGGDMYGMVDQVTPTLPPAAAGTAPDDIYGNAEVAKAAAAANATALAPSLPTTKKNAPAPPVPQEADTIYGNAEFAASQAAVAPAPLPPRDRPAPAAPGEVTEELYGNAQVAATAVTAPAAPLPPRDKPLLPAPTGDTSTAADGELYGNAEAFRAPTSGTPSVPSTEGRPELKVGPSDTALPAGDIVYGNAMQAELETPRSALPRPKATAEELYETTSAVLAGSSLDDEVSLRPHL